MGIRLICVIVPALNEEEELPNLLESIRQQETDFPVMVIVVDNGSEDSTAKIAKAFGANLVSCPTRGIGPARTRGIEALREIAIPLDQVVVFQTDADCRLDGADALQAIGEAFSQDESLMVTVGPTQYEVPLLDGFLIVCGGRQYGDIFGTKGFREYFEACDRDCSDYLKVERPILMIGGNTAYRADVFNLPNVGYSQDRDWDSYTISIYLQMILDDIQIRKLDRQRVTTSARAITGDGGVLTDSRLSELHNLGYIPPQKDPDMISPRRTVAGIIQGIDRQLYELQPDEVIAAVVDGDGSLNILPDSGRLVPILHAGSREPVNPPRQYLIIIDNSYLEPCIPFVNVDNRPRSLTREEMVRSDKHLKWLELLSNFFTADQQGTLVVSGGYAVEGLCGGRITRAHDDIDFDLVVDSGLYDNKEVLINELIQFINQATDINWISLPTKDSWIILRESVYYYGQKLPYKIHIHLLKSAGSSCDGEAEEIIFPGGKCHYGLTGGNLIDSRGLSHSLVFPTVNQLLADKIRIAHKYLELDQFSHKCTNRYDFSRLFNHPDYSYDECLCCLEGFLINTRNLPEEEATREARKMLQTIYGLVFPL